MTNRKSLREVRRLVSLAYADIFAGDWTAAAEKLNEANMECLIAADRANSPANDIDRRNGDLVQIPPHGTLAAGFMELAERATDSSAKAYWRQMAAQEVGNV